MMFISLDAFLGKKNKYYAGREDYLREEFDGKYLLPQVVSAIGEQIIPYQVAGNEFLKELIYEGKKLLLKDALLPKYPDTVKIRYSTLDYAWCFDQESQIWNYLIQNELLFSTDKDLKSRFIDKAPFSKFYNAADAESPGRIGAWIGWQIMRSYVDKNEFDLQSLLTKSDYRKIFKEAKYKPKKE